jgi:hypothetical protein
MEMKTKVTNINGMSIEDIQRLIDSNPTWDFVSSGQTKYTEFYSVQTSRGKLGYSDPPKKVYFAVFRGNENSEEFIEL